MKDMLNQLQWLAKYKLICTVLALSLMFIGIKNCLVFIKQSAYSFIEDEYPTNNLGGDK